jgi:hypothetical protein
MLVLPLDVLMDVGLVSRVVEQDEELASALEFDA